MNILAQITAKNVAAVKANVFQKVGFLKQCMLKVLY